MQRTIAAHERLAAAVTLLGSLPHSRIETLLRAADIFLASSRKEGSGYALIEALACGATPVVTSIPAFRALTGNGAVGVLFPVGDAAAGAAALVAAARHAGERGRVRAHLDVHCSPEVLGRQLTRVYHELLQVGSRPDPRSRAKTSLNSSNRLLVQSASSRSARCWAARAMASRV